MSLLHLHFYEKEFLTEFAEVQRKIIFVAFVRNLLKEKKWAGIWK